MDNILKKIENVLNDNIKSYQDNIVELERIRPTMEMLGKLIQQEITDSEYVYVWQNEIEIDLKGQKRAREFTALLLEKTDIKQFDKTLDTYNAKVKWQYSAKLDGVSIKISPAYADKKCEPTRKKADMSYWVCEMK